MIELLPVDHIDLLVTAAERWRVAIFDDRATESVHAAGQEIRLASFRSACVAMAFENLLAVRRTARPPGVLTSEPGPPSAPDDELDGATAPWRLEFRPVDALDPVEVLKAAHTFEAATAAAGRGRRQSVAQQLVEGVARAAAERVEGYETAPSAWTRPEARPDPPLGVGGVWRPEIPGVNWVDDASELPLERWDAASFVVVTAEFVKELPAHLLYRPRVFVIVEHAPSDAGWADIAGLEPEAVLFWPSCLPWLLERLGELHPADGPGASHAGVC